MTRRHHLERTLREPQWPIRIVTLAIVLAGGAILLATYSRAEARRARAMERVEVGDTVTRVMDALGRPSATCPPRPLGHLRTRFPPDWPAAALENAIERLEEQTAERWIYTLDSEQEAGCAPPQRGTEIGLDAGRRVLWYVPLVGKRPVELPPGFAPADLDTESELPDA